MSKHQTKEDIMRRKKNFLNHSDSDVEVEKIDNVENIDNVEKIDDRLAGDNNLTDDSAKMSISIVNVDAGKRAGESIELTMSNIVEEKIEEPQDGQLFIPDDEDRERASSTGSVG